MRVFEALSELVRRTGQDTVFGLLGGANAAWVADGERNKHFRFVRTRHEQTAVSAAAAHARVSGRTGVATVTQGPGFANTVNALAAAIRDHVPLVLIVGRSPSGAAHGLQDVDQRGIAEALGAGFVEVSAFAQLENAYQTAMDRAEWNGTPQILSVDAAILGDKVLLGPDVPRPRSRDSPQADSVTAAVDVLEAAEHPLILAGWGAVRSGCAEDLTKLSEAIGARVATTLNANGFFSGHPADLGVCGSSSPRIIADELFKTDAVLAVGASLNPFTTGAGNAMFPRAKIIQCEIDADRDFHATSPQLGLLGDARACVRAVLDEWRERGLGGRPVRAPVPTWDQVRTSVLDIELGHEPARGLDLRDVYVALDEKLPPDRVVVTDGGRASHPQPVLLRVPDARSWVPSRGHGSIGLGMGAAIGAAVGSPDRVVALFCGDSGFMMAAQELDAVRLNDLSMVVVVMDDEQSGAELKYLSRFGLPRHVARQTAPDFALLARAFGGSAATVRTDEDLAALEVPKTGLFIVDARIDPEVDGKAIF